MADRTMPMDPSATSLVTPIRCLRASKTIQVGAKAPSVQHFCEVCALSKPRCRATSRRELPELSGRRGLLLRGTTSPPDRKGITFVHPARAGSHGGRIDYHKAACADRAVARREDGHAVVGPPRVIQAGSRNSRRRARGGVEQVD